MNKDTIFLLL